MMNYYNAFIKRYNFLENYYECMSVLNAIHLYFPDNEIIMKVIKYLPAKIVKIKDNIYITIRYNGKIIYDKYTNVKYAPYGGAYKMAIEQALYDIDGVNLYGKSSTNPKPKLVGLNMTTYKDSIIFEITTIKDCDNK